MDKAGATNAALTFMSTIEILKATGQLVLVTVDLDSNVQPNRRLYGTTVFVGWLDQDLPGMETTVCAMETPLEQVDALLDDYIAGRKLSYGRQFHDLRPVDRGVWELKTADVRIFGWFVAKDVFVATHGADASFVKDRNLYSGFRDEAVRIRNNLKLPFIAGKTPNDVLSSLN